MSTETNTKFEHWALVRSIAYPVLAGSAQPGKGWACKGALKFFEV